MYNIVTATPPQSPNDTPAGGGSYIPTVPATMYNDPSVTSVTIWHAGSAISVVYHFKAK